MFTFNSFHNNGLDATPTDMGRGKVTGLTSDNGNEFTNHERIAEHSNARTQRQRNRCLHPKDTHARGHKQDNRHVRALLQGRRW